MVRQGYGKLSNGFHSNTKVLKLQRMRPSALGVYCMAISFCSDVLNDGVMSEDDVIYQLNATEEDIEALIKVGMFERSDDGSYRIHDYLSHQSSREQVETRAEGARNRKRKQRSEADVTPESRGDETNVTSMSRRDNSNVTPESRGDSLTKNQEPITNNQKNFIYNPQTPSGGFEDYPQPFEQFWAACAWQADKPEAYAAWKRAIRETNNATLIAAMSNYAADESNAGYWQKPARWLNNQGWLNKPKPRKPKKPTKADRELDSWRQQFAELYPGWPLPRSRADPLPGNAGYAQQHPGLPPYVQGKSLEECRRLAAQGGESS